MPLEEQVPRFKKSTIHEIFKQTWTTDRLSSLVSATESPPKINDVALHLSAEYLRRFTIELIHRSNQLAEQIQIDQQKQKLKSSNTFQLDDDDDCLIEVRHLQQVAPGVLLDF